MVCSVVAIFRRLGNTFQEEGRERIVRLAAYYSHVSKLRVG
jgi:hypothetical protein